MGVGVGDYTTHAHLRCTLDKAVRDEAIRIGDRGEGSSDSQDAVVDARDDLANAGADTSLVAQVSDILAGLANDDAGFLGGDDSAQSELGLVVLLFGARVLVLVGVEGTELVGDVVNTAVEGRGLDVLGRHGRRVGGRGGGVGAGWRSDG